MNKAVTSACLVSLRWFHQQGVAKSLHFCCLDTHSQGLMGLERFSGTKQHLEVVSINCCSADGNVRNISIIFLDGFFCETILFMRKTWGQLCPLVPGMGKLTVWSHFPCFCVFFLGCDKFHAPAPTAVSVHVSLVAWRCKGIK